MSWNWLVKDMDLSLTFKFKRLSHGSCLMLDSIVVIHSIFTHGYYYLCTLWKVKNESENDLTAINNFMFIWAEVEKKKKSHLLGRDLDLLVNLEKCSGIYMIFMKVWFLLAIIWFINSSFIHQKYQENN